MTQRTRQKLFDLFRNPAVSKSGLASYCRKPPSWLSGFLHPGKRSARPSFHLDDLDDIAGYFRISIGELLGAAKPGELTGDEQRMVHAFRVLPHAMQDHFLAILEAASIGARTGPPRA